MSASFFLRSMCLRAETADESDVDHFFYPPCLLTVVNVANHMIIV